MIIARTSRPVTTTILSAALAASSTWALAQDEGDEGTLEEVVVTGSRVLGLEDSTSPVVTVGQTELEENPSITLADFLVDNITANNGQLTLVDESIQFGRINGDRSTGINLWSLGEENTLTLLNGSRVAYSPAPSRSGWFNVDVNSVLPGIAMQRADILLDGGSAIYGTDAVAGVINFIPRYGFEGTEFRLQSDFYPESIGSTGSAAAEGLFGVSFDEDRGSFLVAVDHRRTYENSAAELGLNDADVPLFDGSEPSSDYEELLYVSGSAYNYAAPIRGGGGAGMGGGGAGLIRLADPLCGAEDLVELPYYWLGEIVPAGGRDPAAAGTCAGYPLPDTDGRNSERSSMFAALSYDLGDTVTGSTEISVSERQIHDIPRFDPNRGGGLFGTIPATHPGVRYNQTISRSWAMAAGSPVSGIIAQFPVGFEGLTGYEASTYNVRAGLEFELSNALGFRIGVSHGTSKATQARMVENVRNYRNAINGLGGPGCSQSSGGPGMGGCEYYNPFISALLPNATTLGLANSPELVAWLADPDQVVRHFETSLSSADALVQVDPGWNLGGGAVGLVAGAEFRQEKASTDYSDPLLEGGVIRGFNDALDPFYGSERIASVFGEVVLPFTDALTMQIAARHEEYESVGGETNPKIGLSFAPTDRVRLRASFGQSLKAPTVFHTNRTVSASVISTGPRRSRRGGQRVSAFLSGAPDISPQTASHFSFGGDFTLAEDQGALRRLELSASFVSFDFDNRIVLLQELDRLPVSPGSGICGVVDNRGNYSEFFKVGTDGTPCFEGIDRNGNGILELSELTATYRTYTNLAKAELEGIDVNLTGRLDLPAGGLNIRLGGTRTLKYDIQDNPLQPPVSAVARYGVLGLDQAVVPEWQMVGGLSMRWARGRQNTSLTGRYKSDIYDDAGQLAQGAISTWDLRHDWDILDSLNLSFTARNVFRHLPFRANQDIARIRDGVTIYYVNLRVLLGEN